MAGNLILLQIVKSLYPVACAIVLGGAVGTLDEHLGIQYLILRDGKRAPTLDGLAELLVGMAIGDVEAG